MKELKNLYYTNRKWFLFYFLIGLSIHMMKLTNYLPCWDSIGQIKILPFEWISSGRWFLGVSTVFLSSKYDLHWLEGILSTALLSLALILVFDICAITKQEYLPKS